MYPIDLSKCSARDVIQRSTTCHPSLFAEALKAASKTHSEYVARLDTMPRKAHTILARTSACLLAKACSDAAHLIEHDADANAPELICADWNMRIVAFTEACRLQCVPPSMRGDIIERA